MVSPRSDLDARPKEKVLEPALCRRAVASHEPGEELDSLLKREDKRSRLKELCLLDHTGWGYADSTFFLSVYVELFS